MKPAAQSSARPTFFLLGAAKAGTTTLYDLLKQHPQVFLSFDKEPMFFSREDYFARGLDWYHRTFFRNSERFPARGEATPHYLYWAQKVAPRMARVYGTEPVKFIVILREPIQRAHAWYWNMVREGEESLPFAEALKAEEGRMQQHHDELEYYGSMRFGYFRGGRYASQIRDFVAHFPADRMHILLLDDLQKDAGGSLREICSFLGIDGGFEFRPASSNPAAMPRNRSLQQLIRRPSQTKSLIKPLLPRSVRHRLKSILLRLNLRAAVHPAMDPEAVNDLKQRFAPELAELSGLVPRDFSGWR